MNDVNSKMNSGASLRVLHFRRIFSLLSEPFIYEPIVEMAEFGVDTHVLTLARMNSDRRPFPADALVTLPQRLHSDRLLARAFSSRFQLSELDRVLWPVLRRAVKARILKKQPDVIVAHFGPEGCLMGPLARQLGIPLAVAFYGYDVSRLTVQAGRRWRANYRRLFEQADLLLGISNHITQRLTELGAEPEKVRRVPLGTRLDRFKYRDPAADYRGGKVRCVHVGRLTAKKAPLHLIRAVHYARQLCQGRPEIELVLAGTGELQESCACEIERLQLQGAVSMLGAVPHKDIPRLLAEAHLYTQHCMTAPNGDMEGLGVSFVEASASGLPVVTTRHNGIPDVVLHEKTGLLSPEGDVQAMGRNIAALASRPEQWSRLGRRGRQHVERSFALAVTVPRLLGVLREILPVR